MSASKVNSNVRLNNFFTERLGGLGGLGVYVVLRSFGNRSKGYEGN